MTSKYLAVFFVIAVAVCEISVSPPLLAQPSPSFRIPITIMDSTRPARPIVAYFGVSPNATCGVDDTVRGLTDHWDLLQGGQIYTSEANEYELPSPPPAPSQYAFFVNPPSPAQQCLPAGGLNLCVRKYRDATQIDTFQISMRSADDFLFKEYRFSWPTVLREYCDSMTLFYQGSAGNVRVNMLTNSFSTYTLDPDNPILPQFLRIYMYRPKSTIPPPPDTVHLQAPANGSGGQEFNPILTWNPVPLAQYYRILVSTDSNLTVNDLGQFQVLLDDTTSSLSKQLTGLQEYTQYYWRVVVYTKYGVSHFQKPVWRFRTKLLLPRAPTLSLPNDRAINVSTTPNLTWQSSPIAPTTYQIQLSKDAGFSVVAIDTTVATLSATVGPVEFCSTYYWRVRGINSSGSGPFSAARSFRVALAIPSAPVLTFPADNAAGVPLTDTLRWTGNSCSDSFRVQLATDAAFTNLIFKKKTISPLSGFSGLSEGTKYFWKVNSVNALDSSSYVTRSFTTLMSPVLSASPPDGDASQPPSPAFRWSMNSVATLYQLQVSSSAGFGASDIVADTTINDTSVSQLAQTLTNCKQYFWRVRPKNAVAVGPYSSIKTFTIQSTIPPPPINLTPPDGMVNVAGDTTLRWAAGDLCSNSYIFQFSKDTLFATVIETDTLAQTSKQVSGLDASVTYFWRVYARSTAGTSLAFARSRFTVTANTVPPAPILTYPSDLQGDISTRPTLMWDSTRRASTFRLQVAKDSNFTFLVVNDSTVSRVVHSKQVGPLDNSAKYFWRVNAKNAAGTSEWSSIWRFFTLFPPNAPFVGTPSNAATDVSITPRFTWSVADRADYYELQIAKDTVFSNLVWDDTTYQVQSIDFYPGLEGYTKFFWRVRAKNSVGWGPWSTISYFTTTRIGSANWLIPLTISETGPARDVVYFGLHPNASAGIDPNVGEYELPPVQSGFFDARFVSPMIGEGLRVDYQKFVNYHQRDTFHVAYRSGLGGYPMKLSWPAGFVRIASDTMLMMDRLVSPTILVNMKVDSSVSITNTQIQDMYIVVLGVLPVTDVKSADPELPKGFVLYQNYPNPFNPTTTIQFSTERTAEIRVSVYDLLGQEVTTLANGTFFPGIYAFVWEGKDEHGVQMPSGVYYVRMRGSSLSDGNSESVRSVSTRKMLMLK